MWGIVGKSGDDDGPGAFSIEESFPILQNLHFLFCRIFISFWRMSIFYWKMCCNKAGTTRARGPQRESPRGPFFLRILVSCLENMTDLGWFSGWLLSWRSLEKRHFPDAKATYSKEKTGDKMGKKDKEKSLKETKRKEGKKGKDSGARLWANNDGICAKSDNVWMMGFAFGKHDWFWLIRWVLYQNWWILGWQLMDFVPKMVNFDSGFRCGESDGGEVSIFLWILSYFGLTLLWFWSDFELILS